MYKEIYSDIPVKVEIKQIYESYHTVLNTVLKNIHNKLKENIKLSSQPTYKVRIKSFESYYKKLLRQRPKDAVFSKSLVSLTDIMGIRLICTFLEDIQDACRQIESIFDVKEIEIKGAEQNFKEFGYESVHILVHIPKDCIPENIKLQSFSFDELVCEIQIRTILQDAWAEVEHELIYKTEFTPFDMPLRRKLASMNASLSLADIIFQEIRDYQKRLKNEMTGRRHSFYDKADELTNNSENSDYINPYDKDIKQINPYVKGTVDDLLLRAIHAHNAGELDNAILIYTEILKTVPKPNNIVLSVILKHRGMAYFSKNDYEKALKDFGESFILDDKNFRAVYYKGIVYSIMSNYEDAVECFTKSLELNEYQSHTFFRRAIAYYNLNNYENSMKDLIAAKKLGLEDKGLDILNDKLNKKFDMNV